MLTIVFKLCQSAEKRWRRLQGYRRLGEVIEKDQRGHLNRMLRLALPS